MLKLMFTEHKTKCIAALVIAFVAIAAVWAVVWLNISQNNGGAAAEAHNHGGLPPLAGGDGDSITVIPPLAYEYIPVAPVDMLLAEQFIEDLDYFIYVLENNFDLFDVAYWSRGTDIHAIAEDIRQQIMNTANMTADDFFFLMGSKFDTQSMGGWFQFITRDVFNSRSFNMQWRYSFSPAAQQRINYPHVQAFYTHMVDEPIYDIVYHGGLPYASYALINHIFYLLYHTLDFPEEAAAFRSLVNDSRYREAMSLVEMLGEHRAANPIPDLQTEIIHPGRIAYMRLNTMWGINFPMRDDIWDFFDEIWGFDHLIIDMRPINSGISSFFFDKIFRPIVVEPLTLNGFAFLRYGSYNSEFTELRGRRAFSVTEISPADRQMRPVEAILGNYELRDIRLEDMERMEYGFRTEMRLNEMRLPRFGYGSAFEGTVWILTSPLLRDGAEVAARTARNQDFAILVGERTSGISYTHRALVSLPNTGILFEMSVFYLTDEHGRPFEAGTYPHHFNREGYDALETVLQLIAEGNY